MTTFLARLQFLRYFILFGFITLFLGNADSVYAQNTSKWKHLSSSKGQLPAPGGSREQTAAIVGDFDRDGVSDMILGFRVHGPALVWYRHTKKGWDRYLIDTSFLTMDAGGTAYDIDGDGDLDLVSGCDHHCNQLWWWENPYPDYNPHIPWERHIIKSEGGRGHHDQSFGGFLQNGKDQLVFWNQGVKTLFLAEIPENPKDGPWPYYPIFSGSAGESGSWYAEGTAAGDVDGDGYTDILAGNLWFKYQGNNQFKAIRFGDAGGRIAVGKFKPGKTMQIVVSPGDGIGYLKWYECIGNPTDSSSWIGHNLIDTPIVHGHTLAVADLNGDGNLDIFAAEMAKWSEKQIKPDNPRARSFIFYGDGKGNFTSTIFSTGVGFHEAKIGDFDGDGDLDIFNKPYNWETPRVDVWLQNGTGKLLPSIKKVLKGKIGVQLYSFRNELKKDFSGTLKEISKMGFTEIELPELYGYEAKYLRDILFHNGLKPSSLLYNYATLRDSIEKVIREAKALDVRYVGCSWLPHGKVLTENDVDRAVVLFNKIGTELKKHNIRFMYHVHGYEFVPTLSGETLMDIMVQKMKPGIADFELDVFWAWAGGQDPALLLKKYPGRFLALHLKDMKEGTPTGIYSGRSFPDESSVELGKGVLDIRTVLLAAIQTGVQKFYIEDESPNAVFQIPNSLQYIETINY